MSGRRAENGMVRSGAARNAAELALLLCVPAVLGACAVAQIDQSALLTLVAGVGAILVFFAGFEAGRPSLRQIMPTVVLAALAAAGRILFAPIPDVKPVSAICIMAGVVFGRRSGFMVGALAALCSNFFFGQGAWTPWQMYSWGLVGYLAGVFADCGLFDWQPVIAGKPRTSPVLYGWGFVSGLLYGAVMNTWYLVGFVHPITWESALLAYGAGLPFDLVHSAATVAFLLVIYAPWKTKLERIKRKYALVQG